MSTTPYTTNPMPLDASISSSLIKKVALAMTLFFIFLIPWGNVIWDGFTRIFGMVSFGLAILVLLVHGTHRQYSFFHLFLLIFGAWATLSLIWSPDMEAGKEAIVTVLQLVFTAFILTLIIDSKDQVRRAYQAYVFGTCMGSSIIIYNFINGIESKYWGRYGLTNFEVDGTSITLALSIPMAAFLATQYKSKIFKIINIIAIPLCIFAIFLTATRTASIVAMFGVAYWLFTHRKANLKIKLLILAFFVSSIAGVFTFAPKASVDRLFTAGKSISSGTLNYRTVIWGASLNQWKKYPIKGNGIGGLAYVLNSSHVEYGSAHNTYIQVLTETGIVGLALYLLIIISILMLIFKSPINDRAFMLSLLAIALVSALSMNTLLAKPAWFVLTMLAVHAYLASKQRRI